MTNAERRLLSAKEASAYLGISAGTAKKMAAEGLLPSLMVGNKRMFPVDRLDAWIDAQVDAQTQPTRSPRLADVNAWLQSKRKEAAQ